MSDDAEIIFSRSGAVGRILLNRPRALNTLNLSMSALLLPQLKAWRADPSVKVVVIAGAGEKAFCAGGDVISLYKDHLEGGDLARTFWHQEYRCNALIKHLGKPYVALLDGIVMGGGVGVSVHGSHRVVTERCMLAMPETAIGLFPDVGATFFLPRLPGAMGMYLGLTGQRLSAADCIAVGLAQHFVPHTGLEALEAALAESDGSAEDVNRRIAAHAGEAGAAPILQHRAAIDRHFSAASVEAILASLVTDASDWALTQRAVLEKCSPLALRLTFDQVRAGAGLSFDGCMRREWRMAHRIAAGHDFFEGVRARLVDKDNAPRWRPASLAEVSAAEVSAYAAPLPGNALDLADISNEGTPS